MIAENDRRFRVACLTLLLDVAADVSPSGVDADRLAVFDFLATNPLLLAGDEDGPDRARLRLAGFDDRALSYASAAQRFITRCQCLPDDLAWLVSYGLVEVILDKRARYRLTPVGQRTARSFNSMYARAFREAAAVVLSRLRHTPDPGLAEVMRQWSAARMHESLGSLRIGR
jgi:hypothetical protein